MELEKFLYELIMLFVTAGLGVVGFYVKQSVNKMELEKYGFDNDRVERILNNAIHYAEQKGKEISRRNAQKLAGNKKLELAKIYIGEADSSILDEYGLEIENMLKRKVSQEFGTGNKSLLLKA